MTRLVLDLPQFSCESQSKHRVLKNQNDPRNQIREEEKKEREGEEGER